MSQSDFDGAVEAFRRALDAFLKGDAGPVMEHWSRRDDVTLANPFGPPRRGPAEVIPAIEAAAANFRDGSIRRFDEVSRYSTADLGYVVHLEQTEARLRGSENMTSFTLRVTVIFRREGDSWKVAHRHADPITTDRPVNTVIEAVAGSTGRAGQPS